MNRHTLEISREVAKHLPIAQNRVANTSKQTQTNTIMSMSIEEAENRFSGHL